MCWTDGCATCHVYVDDDADLDKAAAVAFNAKTYRYGICGAMETLLVAESVAAALLPSLSKQFTDAGVELRGCEKTLAMVPAAVAATDEDWSTEHLAPVLSVKVVDGIEAAIAHIARYGSQTKTLLRKTRMWISHKSSYSVC